MTDTYYSIYKVMFNVDLVCLTVIEKTKTKIKAMWYDLFFYAA